MVKTLRITSVAAAMMAVAICALLIKYGIRTDENIEKFINAPGVIETFKAKSGNITQIPSNQVHPLVQQAEFFANILNPPKPEVTQGTGNGGRIIVKAPPPPPTTPKFKVLTTSYYENNPELSMALIDEPGKGKYWIKQSGTVNHLLIEQIKDGVVIVNNGETTFEQKIEPKKVILPLKGAISRPAPRSGGTTGRPAPANVSRVIPIPNTSRTQSDAQKEAQVEELIRKIELLQAENDDTDDPSAREQNTEQLKQLITELRNSNININDEEAQRLSELGEMLDDLQLPDSGR